MSQGNCESPAFITDALDGSGAVPCGKCDGCRIASLRRENKRLRVENEKLGRALHSDAELVTGLLAKLEASQTANRLLRESGDS